MMFVLIIATVVLSVLYGLAWHDDPTRKPVQERRTSRKQASHE